MNQTMASSGQHRRNPCEVPQILCVAVDHKDRRLVSGGNGDAAILMPASTTSSLSTMSMKKKALDAGISMSDMVKTTSMLHDPVASVKILDSLTPTSMDPHIIKARSVVSTLFGKKKYGEPWQGPLPSPRITPPITLGACLVHDRRGEGQRLGGSPRSEEEEGI